jgi:NAD(P)-dependent dehydrogenase (short-subunit alcohol dehydrogenase family)
MDSSAKPILVTGVSGRVGGVGSAIIEALRCRGLPVRALVRREDQHTDALRARGVEVISGDLTEVRDVARALSGCRRKWRDQELSKRGLSEHLFEHFLTMASLHAANRYDRLTHAVEAITARPATTVRDFVARHKTLFDNHRNTLSPRPA